MHGFYNFQRKSRGNFCDYCDQRDEVMRPRWATASVLET